MRKITYLFVAMIVLPHISPGQDSNDLFDRLQAIRNKDLIFYNIDGIEITSREADAELTPKNITKKYKQLKVKTKELTNTDSLLEFPNFYVFRSSEDPPGIHNNTAYYFIETRNKKMMAFTFNSINKSDPDLERAFIRLVRDGAVPDSVFHSQHTDTVNFAGRKLFLGGNCRWMGINNVQCPYYGQMNWSVHKTQEDAANSVEHQYNNIKAGKHGKIISEETVDIVFEGTEVTAKRAVYDIKGVTSLLVGMSGAKTLTIYFVSAPVRQNFVSCVMSFWNNDSIRPSRLPPLLEEVMELKD